MSCSYQGTRIHATSIIACETFIEWRNNSLRSFFNSTDISSCRRCICAQTKYWFLKVMGWWVDEFSMNKQVQQVRWRLQIFPLNILKPMKFRISMELYGGLSWGFCVTSFVGKPSTILNQMPTNHDVPPGDATYIVPSHHRQKGDFQKKSWMAISGGISGIFYNLLYF